MSWQVPRKNLWPAHFSRDGAYLAVAVDSQVPSFKEPDGAKSPLRIFATRTGGEVASYDRALEPRDGARVLSCAFSPDGSRVAVLSKVRGDECLLDTNADRSVRRAVRSGCVFQ